MKQPSRIAVLIGFLPNPRILKRIELERECAEVHLICWDRLVGTMQNAVTPDGYTPHRIAIKAADGPLRRLLPYARFQRAALRELRLIAPAVVHVQSLDMLKIAVTYKKRVDPKVRIIYEVADLHTLIVDEPKSLPRKLIRHYLRTSDKTYCREIDLLIVTSERYIDRYFGAFVPKEKTLYIPNAPRLTVFRNYEKHTPGDVLTVGYIGGVRYKKQILNLLTAAEEVGLRVMIAGFEDEPVEIGPMCEALAYVTWVGRFDFAAQAAELYARCDLMYSVYDADMANVRAALPNKLYEAVYCGTPLIVAKNTYLAELVEAWGVGVAVDHRGPEELTQVLRRFQDDRAFYDGFVSNCAKHRDEVDLEPYNEKLKAIIEGWGI